MPTEHVVTGSRARRREWIGLAVLALPCLPYSMDLTVLNLAVPSLSADLAPSGTQLLWIVDIYGFLLAGSLITMGTVGDRIGRRRLLLIGSCAFGVASVLAAYSTSAGMLIATRALLGVAGATLAPSTLSLIRNMFLDARQRTTAVAVWATSFSVGAAIGPLLGGVLLERFWWGWVYRSWTIYGLKQVAEVGFGWLSALTIAAGLAVGVAFVRRQHVMHEPLLDLRLFRIPTFSASLATSTLSFFAAFAAFLLVSTHDIAGSGGTGSLAGQPAATSSPLSPPSVSGPTRRTDAPSSASGFWRTSLAAASRIWG